MLFDPARPSSLRSATVDLREAIRIEIDPKRRALALSDLSAAHLLLAESLQSSLEIAVALEAALHALELDPENDAAAFNQNLALLSLGIQSIDQATGADPWTAELRSRWAAGAGLPRDQSRPGCFSRDELREALGTWSRSADPGRPPWLDAQRQCWTGVTDRFFGDLLTDAEASPEPLANAWSGFEAVNQAYRAYDLDAVERELRALRSSTSAPVRLAALSFEASLAYQRTDYRASQAILERLLQGSLRRSYLQLAARAHRLNALIAQIRGDYGTSWSHMDEALSLARQSRSRAFVAAILALRAEMSERSGREDDAWLEATRALRQLGSTFASQRFNCLHAAARLARARGFYRLAALIHHQAVAEAGRVSPVFEIAALKTRGELLASIGRTASARLDLEKALRVLDSGGFAPVVGEVLVADLLLLRGLAGKTVEERESALLKAVDRFKATEYDHRIIAAETGLAGFWLERGNRQAAKELLFGSFTKLQTQAESFGNWIDSSALVAAGRALTGEILALQLDDGEDEEALATLRVFLGLRSGGPLGETGGAVPQRVSYFVRDDELLIFLERGGDVVVERVGVRRRELAENRDLLLLQLHSLVNESRLATTTHSLARTLVDPIAGRLSPDAPLVVVADDVLAGLPFNVLPLDDGGTLLIDRHVLSYSSAPRPVAGPVRPRGLLAVAVESPAVNLPALPRAEDEARAVAEHYASARRLVGGEATAANVERLLGEWDGAHVVSHFVVNPRLPLQSYVALADQSRLTLERLSRASEGLELLYLSACDTGRGLPPAAHGIQSLAQAFAVSRIDTVILSFWPLDDRAGLELATTFHRHLADGSSPAEALAQAQRARRGEHPGLWGPLAVFHG